MSLKEGDSSGPVQLLKIGPGGEEVTILNTGNRVVLNMRDNGFGSTKTAAPGAPVPAGLLRQPPVSGIPASPTIPTAMMPGQLVTPGVNTGINLGAPGASSSSRTDISVAGRGTAPGTINYPGVQQTVASTVAPAISLGANNGGNATMVSGAFNPAPPSASATLNATPAAVPGAMPPNSTPPNTIPVRNGITPPFPGR
jgi:hypothetical protein